MQSLKKYGCACECLLELCRKHGRDITEDEFLNEFARRYPIWFSRPGVTNEMTVCEIAKSLGIANSGSVFIDKERVIEFAKHYKEERVSGVLVYTERMPVNGALAHIYHTMLLLDADQDGFRVWCPYQNAAPKEETHTWKEWSDWMMHALVLGP